MEGIEVSAEDRVLEAVALASRDTDVRYGPHQGGELDGKPRAHSVTLCAVPNPEGTKTYTIFFHILTY